MKRRFLTWLVLCASLLIVAACSTTPVTSLPSLPDEDLLYPRIVTVGDVIEVGYYRNQKLEPTVYKIGVGDVLRIDVSDIPELSQTGITVLPDGRISLPLIGSLSVAGKTVDEVSTEAARLYRDRKIKDPVVVISVREGQQQLRLLMQSLLNQQGLNALRLRVYSDQPLALPFIRPVAVSGRLLTDIRRDVKAAYEEVFGGQLEVTVNLRDRAPQSLHIMGEVQRPGSIQLTRRVNLLTAIAMASGFAGTADQRQVLVIRFKEDGSYDRWVFDLKEGMRSANYPGYRFQLQANDVIFVPRSDIAKANLFVEQYIRRMLPIPLSVGAGYSLGSLE